MESKGLSKGWFGKVPGVRYETLDGLERYLMYGMGLWMVLKCARSAVWFLGSSYSS
jgi:hypothetical protein